MPRFRTTLSSGDYNFQLSHKDHIFCMGSCFAEHIGHRLEKYKFSSLLNPLGILYNPDSISAALNILLQGKVFKKDDLFFDQGRWHSLAHHSNFSFPDSEKTLLKINNALRLGRDHLLQTDLMIITFGTAKIFRWKENGQVVANCHKIPATYFTKELLSIDEITIEWKQLLDQLFQMNPHLKVLFTVSPVRHIRDGLIANQRSKARLLLAIQSLEKQFSSVHYFPAYEIVLDDLRDYRFYEADLIHPNEQAIDYIWEYFCQSLLADSTKALMSKIGKIIQASKHRPFHPQSEAHQIFIDNQLTKIAELEMAHAFLDFSEEKTILSEQQL